MDKDFSKDFLAFLEAASTAIEKDDHAYEFVCPLCGKTAQIYNGGNDGHIHARCKQCNIIIFQ